MEPRNRFQGIDSASLCCLKKKIRVLARRYDSTILTRFLAHTDFLQILALNQPPAAIQDIALVQFAAKKSYFATLSLKICNFIV
jgi:hypothetical protein